MTKCVFHERCKADCIAEFAGMPGLVAMFEKQEHCNVKPEKRTACNLYQGYAAALEDGQARWLKQYEWAHTIKVGDRLTVQAIYNDTTTYDKLPTPCEVLEIDYTRRSGTDVMLRVRAVKGRTLWLDAGWFYSQEQAQC